MVPLMTSGRMSPLAGHSAARLAPAVIAGPVRSTIHVHVAGVGSLLPVRSTARTANVCVPSPRPLIASGLEHVVNAAPSSEHSNPAMAERGSLPLKRNAAAVLVVGLVGALSMNV